MLLGFIWGTRRERFVQWIGKTERLNVGIIGKIRMPNPRAMMRIKIPEGNDSQIEQRKSAVFVLSGIMSIYCSPEKRASNKRRDS